MFEKGGRARAFLPPDKDIDGIRETIEKIGSQSRVEKGTVSYTDMFNYYTYIHSP